MRRTATTSIDRPSPPSFSATAAHGGPALPGRAAGLALATLVVLGGGSPAVAAESGTGRPDAVPYRPTVSAPADLTAPGWLEAEIGGLYARDRHTDDSPVRRLSVPYALKYAFTEDWGLRLGGEAVVHGVDADGTRATGFGDTAIIGKRRFVIDERSAFGLETGVMVPTARHRLQTGSGKPDLSINGIYSADAGPWHGDLNVTETRFGARDASGSRMQILGALAISRRVGDGWTVEAEVSGTRQRNVAATSQMLAAVSFALRRDVVVDFGVAHGLNHASPTWQGFSGVTVVVGRL